MPSSITPYTPIRGSLSRDPFTRLEREMTRFFDDFLRGDPLSTAELTPCIDVRETPDELCMVADLPGVDRADLDVRLDGDTVIISGEKKDEAERREQDFHMMERSVGRFRRSLQLPYAPDPEQVKASFDKGVLTLHLPKQGAQGRSHHIDIQSGAGPSQAGQAAAQQGLGGSAAGSESPDDAE